MNLSGRKSHGRTIDSRDDRVSMSPALLWKLSDRTSLTLLGSYSRERGTPKSWWPNLFYYPEVTDLPLKRTAGDPAFDYFNRDTKAIGYALEHDTESGWRLRQNLRYSEIDIDYRHIYSMAVLADQRAGCPDLEGVVPSSRADRGRPHEHPDVRRRRRTCRRRPASARQPAGWSNIARTGIGTSREYPCP